MTHKATDAVVLLESRDRTSTFKATLIGTPRTWISATKRTVFDYSMVLSLERRDVKRLVTRYQNVMVIYGDCV